MKYLVYNQKQIAENLELLADFYIPNYGKDYAESLKGTDYVSLAIDKGKIIGALRIITDGGTYAFIVDFYVRKDNRGAGVGGHIVNNITKYLATKVKVIAVVASPERPWLVEYYTKLGFVRDEGTYMKFVNSTGKGSLNKKEPKQSKPVYYLHKRI